ncbi:CHASE3 domain-containing protein [Phycisphaerales bacterium AB-hyl4]|uniref:histidine kinase n=1 Tax=Natronomicrosphaera hydrolytica TaxID=3242702 RepID=A0ABV4UAP2_9BACT
MASFHAGTRREIAVLVAGLLLVTSAMAGAVVSSYMLWEAKERVERTHELRSAFLRVLWQAQDIETGQRGYVITGDDAFLRPYRQARERLDVEMDQLMQLTAGNPTQRARAERLRSLAGQRLQLAEQRIAQRRDGDIAAVAELVQRGQGEALSEQVRAVVEEADREAIAALAEREARAARRWGWLLASSIFGGGVGALLVVGAMMYARHSRHAAESAWQQFRSLFEAAPGAYLVVEPTTYRIVAVSDAYLRATMTRRSALLGRTLFEVFPDDPDDPSATGERNLRASLERVKSTKHPDAMAVQHYPIPRPTSAGGGFEQRWWSPLNSPVVDGEGKLVYIIHRVEDVTPFICARDKDEPTAEAFEALESQAQHLMAGVMARGQALQEANEQLRESEERLRHANRELSDFATIVSHDLKSPLRAVSTLARWMRSDYGQKLDEEGRAQLEEMVRVVGRMDQMIDDILEYARLGRTEGRPRRVALAELLPTVVSDLRPPADVRVEFASDPPVVKGDPVRLRQVFLNLIGNAIKHGRQATDGDRLRVEVSWERTEAGWEFCVSDNGPGIEAAHHERIFRMFQTLKPRDESDSTGVGLALVKRIVEQVGGEVWVASEPGAGCRFHFTWPGAVDSPRSGEAAVLADEALVAGELHRKRGADA